MWKIERCAPSSNSHCSVIWGDLMKHCNAWVITRRTICGIFSPCYDGLWFDSKGFTPICHKFWFCANDLTHHVGGIGRKFCVDKPCVPSTWLAQVGTNLIQFEVITLEEAWFIMCEAHKYVPWIFFVNESTTPPNRLANLDAWPNILNNMPIWQATMLKLSMQQINMWEARWTLEPTFLSPTKFPSQGYGHIYIMSFGPPPNTKQYDDDDGKFPYLHLCWLHNDDGKFLGWSWEMGALQTPLFHLAKCDVLWPNGKFDSFFNKELAWSATPNELC